MDCWQCGRSIDDVTERYFCDCGVVQPPVAERSYFDIMGIKESFDVDLTELTEKYRGLQRILHPDKYSQKCDVCTSHCVFYLCRFSSALKAMLYNTFGNIRVPTQFNSMSFNGRRW